MLHVAVLVISNKILSGTETDKGRTILEQVILEHQMKLLSYEVIADDRSEIRSLSL